MIGSEKRMRLEIGYLEDGRLRAGLNALTRAIYGFDFEAWYRGGFADGTYIPFTFFEGDEAVANVSVSELTFRLDGGALRLAQIGTVMTARSARGRGLSRALMEAALKRCAGRFDGVYLFANDSVLDFYPRFGFERAQETAHSFAAGRRTGGARKLSMDDPAQVQRVAWAMRTGGEQARLSLSHPAALGMFYAAGFMRDCVYELESGQIAVADFAEDALEFSALYGEGLSVREAAACLARADGERVRLGFTPNAAEGMSQRPLREEDTTLFVRGFRLPEGVRFPALSHA